MLILTRRVRETLMIGDDVAVTILGVTGTRVRVGIDAPRAKPVHRCFEPGVLQFLLRKSAQATEVSSAYEQRSERN